ncbi:LuxR C-terminal-related transcriptional regulator [Streptomyces sp. NPDC048290]|uniref:LuxR C-terminal-related transcriptional regulator n=1 Tax=Streptomyces sp. NPDC048290 TaxID=3155811 RepID=UPI003442D88C
MGRIGGTTRSGTVQDAAVRAATSAESVEAFFDEVARVIVPALRVDMWAGVTVDPRTLMNTGGNYRCAVPAALMPRMLDIEYCEGDVNSIPDLARKPVPVGLLSEEVGGRLELSPRYRDIAGPLGFRDELRVALRDRHGAWGALVLGRAVDAPAFTPADLALAESLAQPLGSALRRLHLTDRAHREPAPTAPGLVLLDEEYNVLQMSPAFPLWIDGVSLPPTGRTRSPAGASLPPAVYGVAAAVRAPGAASSFTSWAHSGSQGSVRLHAWRLDDLTEARVAVVVEPAGPGERLGVIVAAYGLSAREQHITELVLHGHSTAEIARRAGLSPHTVQDHLKSVFDKTGVRSRRDLVATLFVRHHAPALAPTTPPQVCPEPGAGGVGSPVTDRRG